MVRLRMEGSPDGLQDILLQPGLNRLGRSEDNDFQISNDSISSHHCQIDLTDDVITVRDLGSTNGTFLDGQPIQSAVLQPGQMLGLGTVRMVCQGDPVRQPVRISLETPPAARESSRSNDPVGTAAGHNAEVCGQHPEVAAKWACIRCGAMLCGDCVKTMRVGMKFVQNCPKCDGSCVSVSEYRRLAAPAPVFSALWREAFSYPLKKDGAMLLVCGTIIFSFLEGGRWVLLTAIKFLGILSASLWFAFFLCLVMSAGYLFALMQNIVQASSRGEEKMPDWPEISGFWDDLAVPFFRFTFMWFICLGPGIAVMLFVSPMAGVPFLLLGLFCLPMAILTVCLADGIHGLNPIIIFSGIGKVPLPYLAICGIFLVIIGLMHGSRMLLELTGIPVLPTVISTFISLYGITVEMRLLGLLYFTNKSKLAWFE